MTFHSRLALGATAGVAVALLSWIPSAHAGPLGAGETLLSGTTTPGGVGETSVTRVPGSSRDLVVWEGDRSVATGAQQGTKAEIFGRYVSSQDGTAQGSPVLLASLGTSNDATLDAVDPSVAALSNGKIVLTFAGDTISDTVGGPTPVDTTNFQIYGAVIDPGQALGAVSPTALTAIDAGDPAYDQRHPDIVDDHGQVRVVWEGDSAASGDGQTEVWTTLVPNDLSGTATVQKVSTGHPAGAAFDHTRPRVAAGTSGSAPDAVVVWEGVYTINSSRPVRRVWESHLGAAPGTPQQLGDISIDTNTEEVDPDITATASGYEAVWSANSSGDYQIFETQLSAAGTVLHRVALTTASHDTLPSVVSDPSQPNQFVVTWVRRTATAGTGHYELYTGRWLWGPSPIPVQLETNQLSSVDSNVSADNTESLRPALAYHPGDHTEYAAWGRDRVSGGPGVAGRLIAPRGDVFVTVAPSPTRPSPARPGLNPADPVDVLVTYGNNGDSATLDATLAFQLPGFTPDASNPVTFQNLTSPTPTPTGTPGTYTITGLAPGRGGVAVFHGTMDAAPEGTVRTATATITPSGIYDDPTLNNSASADLTLDYPPTVQSITRAGSTPTNASSVSWTVTFDQVVSGVSTADFVTTGTGTSSVTAASCVGKACTVTAAVTADGTVGLRVPVTATIQDGSGKALATGNLPFDGPTYTVDTVRPSVIVSSGATDPTNANPITFHLAFSEPVQAPAGSALTATHGTVSSVTPATGLASDFDVEVSPASDGDVSLAVPAGATTDAAGNANTAGVAVTRTSDRTRPTLTVDVPTTPQGGPFQVTVTPSEAVTGFALSDVEVTGGAASDLTGTGPWTLTVAPDTEGTVTVTLPAGSVRDLAGNDSLKATADVTYDVTRPGVTVGSSAADPTGTSPVPFTLTFTEPVTGLTVVDLTVTGGTAQLTGTGASYVVLVTPSADGPVSVAVPADVAADAAGNPNTVGDAATRTYDSTRPSATISTSLTDPTSSTAVPVTVTWSEPVSGFDASDVSVDHGTVTGFSGSGTTYTFTVDADADGVVEISIPAGSTQDGAGNASLAATPLDVTVDTTAPTGAFSTSEPSSTNSASVPVTLTFDEPVTGLALGDLSLVNATADSLSGSGTTYHLVLHPQAEGAFSVALAAGAVQDTAGNDGADVDPLVLTYDLTATADLTYGGPSLVNAPVDMSLHLSDPASISPSDFATTNASVSLTGGGDTWTVTVTPAADGDVSVRLKAGAFTDAAGNPSSASATRMFSYDATAPTVEWLHAPSLARGAYQVEVTFSEPVTTPDLAQVAVTNGTASDLSGSGRDWTFTVTPGTDGDVAVSLGTGTAYDPAGNASVAAGPVTTHYDATAPTVLVSSPTADVVTSSPIDVAVTFSEPVADALADPAGSQPFSLADVQVDNGTATGLTGGGTSYTLQVVPATEGTVTVSVPAGAVVDTAGNLSLASNVLSREFDSTRPTVAMTTTATSPTNVSPIPVTVQFNKPVLGFELADLQADGGNLADFTELDARTWTFDLVPTGDGTVGVTLPENAAASRGGNLAFGTSLSLTVDRTAPAPGLSGPTGTMFDRPVRFTLTSPEPLLGLTGDDLLLGGSAHPSALSLTTVDAQHWTLTASGMTRPGTVTVRLPAGAATDLAGNSSMATVAAVTWDRHVTFALVQAPGTRLGNRVTVPLRLTGKGVFTVTTSSSNHALLPNSRVTVSGAGPNLVLTLDGRPGTHGRSHVVLRADIGGVQRRLDVEFIVGGPGDNRLVGTTGTDVVLGRHGADHLDGRGGDDYLYAGGGADIVRAGRGDDLVVGSVGRDVLYGGPGRDGFVVYPHDSRPDYRPGQDFLIRLPARVRRLMAD